jgi:hypothetical protein
MNDKDQSSDTSAKPTESTWDKIHRKAKERDEALEKIHKEHERQQGRKEKDK